MSQLGFTFYPKDWWTSDSFFLLQPFERYVYLECIFIMYSQDGWMSSNKLIVERRLGTTIKDEVWNKITNLFISDGDKITHKSVNSRMRKTISNRQNGLKGGRPPKPKKPKSETQNNPPLEIEIEEEVETENDSVVPTPPTPPKSFKQFTELDFKNEIKPFVDEYGSTLCNNFYSYWTELSASGKMKFKLEKTWSTKGRLSTWQRNEDKFGFTKPQSTETTTTQPKRRKL